MHLALLLLYVIHVIVSSAPIRRLQPSSKATCIRWIIGMHDVLLVSQRLYWALAGVISDFLKSLIHPLPLLVAACIVATILLP